MASLATQRSSPRARFGGYVLTDQIGSGGMAVVYRAKIEGWSGFEKTVVVKAMHPSLAKSRDFVEMFIAEAKISAQLSHPGIVQVHDFGVFKGTPYLVMEHLNGINLSQLLHSLADSGRVMPVGVALVVVTEMCHALGYAHAYRDPMGVTRQIIHSDVSPSNVMMCRDGSVKLLDFGVASIVDEWDYDVTVTLKGKYPYMAPEQVNRLPIDRRADVFAAGIVLHELLTGRRLFAGENELQTLKNVDEARVEAPSKLNPDVPATLDAVVLKALARDPADRFDNGEEMAAALEKVGIVGGGRRRVAEFLAETFPREWTTICQVCGKNVTPGFVCVECGSQTPVEHTDKSDPPAQDTDRTDASELRTQIVPSPPLLPEASPLVAERFPQLAPVAPRRRSRKPGSKASVLLVVSTVVALAAAAWVATNLRVTETRPLPVAEVEPMVAPFAQSVPSESPPVSVESVPAEPPAAPATVSVAAPVVAAPKRAAAPRRVRLATAAHASSAPATRAAPPPPPSESTGASWRLPSPIAPSLLSPEGSAAPAERRVKDGRLIEPFAGGK